jgi:hypothetical protein
MRRNWLKIGSDFGNRVAAGRPSAYSKPVATARYPGNGVRYRSPMGLSRAARRLPKPQLRAPHKRACCQGPSCLAPYVRSLRFPGWTYPGRERAPSRRPRPSRWPDGERWRVVKTKLLVYSVGAASSRRRAADVPVVEAVELDHQRTAGEPAGLRPLLLNCAPRYVATRPAPAGIATVTRSLEEPCQAYRRRDGASRPPACATAAFMARLCHASRPAFLGRCLASGARGPRLPQTSAEGHFTISLSWSPDRKS